VKIKLILYVTIMVHLLACSRSRQTETVEPISAPSDVVTLSQQQFDAAKISMGTFQKQKISNEIQVNGIIDVPPQSLIIISPPMGGFVKATALKEGMKVRKGDLLVTLENIEFIQLQQDYLENKSKLDFLKAEYERQQELAKENINSGKTMQLARSNYEAMKATVNSLEAKLRLINITPQSLANGEIRSQVNMYSPIDGFVSSVNVNLGEYFNSTDHMFKIINLDHLHVLLYVYEKDIQFVREGQEVKFKLGGGNEEKLATIYLIGKEITQEKTVHVHCHLKEDKQNLLPGMYVSAVIQVDEKETEVVPSNAIVTYQDQHVVFMETGTRQFKMISVDPGQSNNNFTEVALPKDVPAGTKVVISGANHLLGVLKNGGEEE
jgi:membrane fusion protein, heavy metal efflux system